MPIKNTPLKIARITAGLSQKEFAKETGITTSVISEIENGWRIPKPRELERIRKVLPQFNEVG